MSAARPNSASTKGADSTRRHMAPFLCALFWPFRPHSRAPILLGAIPAHPDRLEPAVRLNEGRQFNSALSPQSRRLWTRSAPSLDEGRRFYSEPSQHPPLPRIQRDLASMKDADSTRRHRTFEEWIALYASLNEGRRFHSAPCALGLHGGDEPGLASMKGRRFYSAPCVLAVPYATYGEPQ